MRPWELERLTPSEFNLIMKEYKENKENETEDKLCVAITQAHYTASFYRAKKIPKLKTILKKFKSKNKNTQTPEQMFEMVKSLNTRYGGKIV